jgi:four helix bundle protein
MCKEDKNKEIIRIVLNKRHDIQYASIDNQNAIKYLEKLGDLYRLTDNFPIEYDLEDYNVTIDEVNITGNMYYVITAVLRHPKCKNCRKALTDAVTGLYRLADQLIRASRSIGANIAEGNTQLFVKRELFHANSALGSAGECRNHLLTAYQNDYINREQYDALDKKLIEIIKMLFGYIKGLKSNSDNESDAAINW